MTIFGKQFFGDDTDTSYLDKSLQGNTSIFLSTTKKKDDANQELYINQSSKHNNKFIDVSNIQDKPNNFKTLKFDKNSVKDNSIQIEEDSSNKSIQRNFNSNDLNQEKNFKSQNNYDTIGISCNINYDKLLSESYEV